MDPFWRGAFSGAVAMLIACLLFYSSAARLMLSSDMITALVGAVVGALIAVGATIVGEDHQRKAAARPFFALLPMPTNAVATAMWSMDAMIKEKSADGERGVASIADGVPDLHNRMKAALDELRSKVELSVSYLPADVVTAFGKLDFWVGVCIDLLDDGFVFEDGVGIVAKANAALAEFKQLLPSAR